MLARGDGRPPYTEEQCELFRGGIPPGAPPDDAIEEILRACAEAGYERRY